MKAYEALEKAAEYMSEHGHCKNAVENDAGEVCLIGAIHKTTPTISMMPVLEAMDDYARGQGFGTTPGYGFNAIDWNNHPDTTGEDVILGMKTVASELRNQKENK